VVKVTNLATLEASLIAPLRSRRPTDGGADPDPERAAARLAGELAHIDHDPFCNPETGTPADPFGRVRGRRTVTGANAAKADGQHGVIVFDVHDPLGFDADLVADVLSTGRAWADRARADDRAAANYLLVWNCLWRAGGSIVHGHAQVLLGSGLHYARLERWRRDAVAHRATTGRGLTSDLVAVHRDVGLALDLGDGLTLLAHMTPAKDRELILLGHPGGDERDPAFAAALGRTLIAYRDIVGVRAFNLALWRPPIADDGGVPGGWEELVPQVRLVDRGDPFSRASDIGAMELYASPVVGTDPYALIATLRTELGG